jgi:hypothetical protein
MSRCRQINGRVTPCRALAAVEVEESYVYTPTPPIGIIHTRYRGFTPAEGITDGYSLRMHPGVDASVLSFCPFCGEKIRQAAAREVRTCGQCEHFTRNGDGYGRCVVVPPMWATGYDILSKDRLAEGCRCFKSQWEG